MGGLVFRSRKDIEHIGFGIVQDQSFDEQFKRDPVWVSQNRSWSLRFDETLTIPDDVAYTTLRIRKYLSGGGWIDENIVIPTDRYPYAENEILFSISIMTSGIAAGGFFRI